MVGKIHFVITSQEKTGGMAFFVVTQKLTMRTPERLQLARAVACSEEVLLKWYVASKQFLEVNNLADPARIWNADETSCPLCPKSGKVLALSGAKNVYQVTADTKEQVITLCATSAAGIAIPPMHIFSGQRFWYNPLDGCVAGAYFGKSEKGWIKPLFYGWLAIQHTCIDLETSKLCKENDILWTKQTFNLLEFSKKHGRKPSKFNYRKFISWCRYIPSWFHCNL